MTELAKLRVFKHGNDRYLIGHHAEDIDQVFVIAQRGRQWVLEQHDVNDRQQAARSILSASDSELAELGAALADHLAGRKPKRKRKAK